MRYLLVVYDCLLHLTENNLMSESVLLITTLKKTLKLHSLTYADVAKHLNLTQASIKRLFSQGNISLERLDQICHMMDLEISDVVKIMSEQRANLNQLTYEQELDITNDLTLLLVTVCVLNKWSMLEIMNYHQLSETVCIQKLAKLDRLAIIDLLPNNKIKLKVSSNFSWRDNGPIQHFFHKTISKEYFNSQFNHKDEKLLVLNGMLSAASNAEFQRKLQRLTNEFEQLNREDSYLPLTERDGVTAVLAMRGWRYGVFDSLTAK